MITMLVSGQQLLIFAAVKDGGKMRKRQMSASDIVLGKDGDGIAVPEEGIEGRWFVDGVDVNTTELSEKHY